MRVLIACEFSGTVRDAFRAHGHDAWSCDLLPGEGRTLGDEYPTLYPEGHQLRGHRFHYQCDVFELLPGGRLYQTMALENQAVQWDLMIAHPPCTHLAVSGARWFKEKAVEQVEALAFVQALMDAPIPHICIENPVSIISSRIRKPDQIIQPWQYGHGEVKATCLWLKGLPKLMPTNVVDGRHPACWLASPGPDRWKLRSRTYEGIAQAMADQWGSDRSLQMRDRT